MNKYEVVIIGAGPAGLSTAINLYNKGIKEICIVTNGDINSHKPCAGLLPKKSYDILKQMGIDIEKHIEYYKGKNLTLYYKNKEKCNIDFDECFCYYPLKFNRKDFDVFLYNYVLNLGIKIYEKENIKNDILKDNKIILNSDEINYKYLIFADGTSGYSSRYNTIKSKNISLEVVFERSETIKPFVNLYFGITKRGYAWIASTGKVMNIGITDKYSKKVDYKELLFNFAKDYGYEINNNDIKGAFYPNGVRKLMLNDNVYVIGDAAGLADPLTAEGIYYAILSGKNVAESIFNKDKNIYIKNMSRTVKNFNLAKIINKFFFIKLVQSFFWKKKKINPNGFRIFAFNKIMLTGEYGYTDILKCRRDYKKRK